MDQIQETGTQQEQKMKTRCYYSTYVNHMIRFYLSTPEKLETKGKRGADIANWIAVQDIWHKLHDSDRDILVRVYSLHYRLAEGVRMYCKETGADPYNVWVLITKTCSAIAKRRGLI